MTKAEQILAFYNALDFDRKYLDADLEVLNPFEGASAEQEQALSGFYHKFYSDDTPRNLILGINPGRLGAGATGIPFTDTKRLIECGIPFESFSTHEPSSVFVYEAINAFGGPEKFYREFFIGSVCPLGFVVNKNGNWVNFNYYDRASFSNALGRIYWSRLKSKLNWPVKMNASLFLALGRTKVPAEAQQGVQLHSGACTPRAPTIRDAIQIQAPRTVHREVFGSLY